MRSKASKAGGGYFRFVTGINEKVDALLGRLFRLPSWVSESDEGRLEQLGKISAITGLLIWGSLVLSSIALASQLPIWLFLPVLLVGILYGFLVQYLVYHISRNINAMIIGQRIVMSSIHFSRFYGMISLIVALICLAVCLVHLCNGQLSSFFLSLIYFLLATGIIYFNFNAEKTIVTVEPAAVSPGREFNNYLRFIIRVSAATMQVLAPLIIVLGLLSFICFVLVDFRNLSSPSMSSLSAIFSGIMSCVIFIHVPIVTWLVLGIGSWVVDLLDGLYSLSGRSSQQH